MYPLAPLHILFIDPYLNQGKQAEIAAVRAREAAEGDAGGGGGGPFGSAATEASIEYLPGVAPRLPGEEAVATANLHDPFALAQVRLKVVDSWGSTPFKRDSGGRSNPFTHRTLAGQNGGSGGGRDPRRKWQSGRRFHFCWK